MDYLPNIPAAIVLIAVTAAAAWTDLRRGIIPNRLSYAGIGLGLALGLVLGGPAGLAASLGGLAAGGLPMLAAWLLGGVGGGDVKLLAAVGALSNWRFTLAVLAASFAAAALWAVATMLSRGIAMTTLRRIGRALLLAALTRGRSGWPDESRSPRLAFAVAVLAALAAVWLDALLGGPLSAGLAAR